MGNSVVETTTQNSLLQITGRTAAAGGATLLQLAVGYNAAGSNNGNIKSEQIVTSGGLNVTQTFSPDAYNRLLTMSETSGLRTETSFTL